MDTTPETFEDAVSLVYREQDWRPGDRVEYYDAAEHAWREGTVTDWRPTGPGAPVLTLRFDNGTEMWTRALRAVRQNLIAERDYWRERAQGGGDQ